MLLGDAIARLDDAAVAEEAMAALDNLPLVLAAEQRAAQEGMPVGALIRECVGHFCASASPDAWMALMTTAGRSEDPATACLEVMLRHVAKEAGWHP
jgi:hypothetical protein